jgi:HD-GYP domain-containing protein (c-di-GMP phosphodiesterase class II)
VDTFLRVKTSQIFNYNKTPLYILNRKTGYVLYKAVNKKIDRKQYAHDNHPELYINASDRANAVHELQEELNKQLCDKIRSGTLSDVKNTLCEIVSETFSEPIESSIATLPDTIDIVYDGYSKAADVLKDFSDIHYAGYPLVNHSVNVMAVALFYCLRNQIDENETKRVSLCALLHDVGVTKLPNAIVGIRERLSDEQFREYQAHPSIGHDIVKTSESIDSSIATGILEHHERLDGNGYPRGIANLSFEGRLIGLIDSFDSLTNSEKSHRKKRKPFDALMVIKDDVLKLGRFDKDLYKDLCLTLGEHR